MRVLGMAAALVAAGAVIGAAPAQAAEPAPPPLLGGGTGCGLLGACNATVVRFGNIDLGHVDDSVLEIDRTLNLNHGTGSAGSDNEGDD